MIHIHARRPDGTPSYEIEDFQAIADAILAEVGDDVIINFSTGAIGVPIDKRIAYLRACRPDVAALNMGSMNYAKYSAKRKEFVFKAVFANPFDEIIELLEAMNELGIKPEHECFDVGHVGSLAPLVDMGVLHPPLHVSCVMGVTGGHPAQRAQPRADGRQHPGRLALGRDRDQPRAVDARRRLADAGRVGPRRAGGQLLPARRRRWPAPTATSSPRRARSPRTSGGAPRRWPRRARCSASRGGSPRERTCRSTASASWTSAACCPAASARCCWPTSAPTSSRSRTPAWATTSAGRTPYYEGAEDSAKSALFLALNRGKRSMRLNLKSRRGPRGPAARGARVRRRARVLSPRRARPPRRRLRGDARGQPGASSTARSRATARTVPTATAPGTT